MSSGKQRYIRDEIWRDSWFYQLPLEQKTVWLYLLTNPNANVAGLYKLNTKVASNEIGIAEKQLEGVLKRFVGDGKLAIYQDWIFLVNFYKNQTASPKIMAGIKRILAEAPEPVQQYLYGMDTLPIPYRTSLHSTLLNSTLPDGVFPDEPDTPVKFSEKDMAMAQLLVDLIKRNNPDWQLRGNMDTWAEHIDKLHRIDKRTYQQIEFMIRWTQNHNFWQQNILSTAKLRDQFNNLIPKVKAEAAAKYQQNSKPKMLWVTLPKLYLK